MTPLDRLTYQFGFYFTDYGKHQLAVLVVAIIIVFTVGIVIRAALSGGSPTRPKTIEDLAQEAAWLRARGNLAEAEQDYKLKHASLQQTEKFIKENIRK